MPTPTPGRPLGSATPAANTPHLPFAIPVRIGSLGWRLCEKTIVANQWAIYCRCARRRRGEDFGYTILRAIGLLVFVKVMTFHTASVESCHSPAIGSGPVAP